MNDYSYPMTLNEESQKAKDIVVNCSISREKLKNGSDEFDAKRVLLKNDISFEEQLKVIKEIPKFIKSVMTKEQFKNVSYEV